MIILLVLLVLLLSSCDINENGLLTKNPISSENSITLQSNEKELEIKKVSYSNPNVNISYPEIINHNNLEHGIQLNEILKSEAMQSLEQYGGNEQGYELDVDYIPKWVGNTLISIQYIGSSYVKDGAHPKSLFFTVNHDVKNSRKLLLKDVVKINDEFIDLLRGARYVPYDSDLNVESEAREELSNYSNAELIAYLNKSDELSDINELGVFTYFADESLGISFNVPHALGDHVEFEIKYSDLKNHILTQNIVWRDTTPTLAN